MNSFIQSIKVAKDKSLAQLAVEPSGLDWSDTFTELVDSTIRDVFYSVEHEHPHVGPLSLIATGGYGRRELSPCSDIDLAVIPLDERASGLDEAIRSLFNQLHAVLSDGMGMKVDYAYRLVTDAPGFDPKTRTSLLESRLVAGSDRPYERLMASFWQYFPVGDFLIQKIEERKANYNRTHSTPLVVTPQLKEGAGGLRDFHAANWIRQALGERSKSPNSSYDEVLLARNVLHLIKGKRSDQLTHVSQAELAKALGLDPREMMRRLHSAMVGLHSEWREALDRIPESRFELAEGVYAIRGEVRVASGATVSDAALGVAHATKLGIDVLPIATATQDAVTANQALRALLQGEPVVRRLEACGVLSSLLPELTATKTLLPDDQSHQYTVYEHTLQALQHVDSLRTGSGFLAEAFHRIHDKGAFVLGVLLHDVGKADASDSHSATGERMVHQLARRWKLDQDRAELVAWLVKHHLLMSHTIRMRDVSHPETVREFASQVETTEKLLMLTVLTWADSNAVAPGIWTQAQDGFLRELFERTEAILATASNPITDPEAYRNLAKRSLRQTALDEKETQSFLASLPGHYLLSTDPAVVPFHFELARRAAAGETVVVFEAVADLGATELTICAPDSPGLLSRVLGLIYALDLGLIGLRASTTTGPTPVALDVLTITFGGEPVPTSTCAALKQHLLTFLESDDQVIELLKAKGKTIDTDPGEAKITFHSGSPSLLELRGRRGRGMAYRFSRIIAQQGWNILGARVGQWAGQSTASFTLTAANGGSLQSEQVSAAFGPLV